MYMCVTSTHLISVGLARTIHIRCKYGILGREITKYMAYIYNSGQPYVLAITRRRLDTLQTKQILTALCVCVRACVCVCVCVCTIENTLSSF